MAGQTNVVVKSNGTVSGARAVYVGLTKLSETEKPSRTFFSETDEGISINQSEKYLIEKGEKLDDNSLFEFFVSPEEGTFQKLGTNQEERIKGFRDSLRSGITEMCKILKIKEMRYVFGIHQNTNNIHAHVLVSKQMVSEDNFKIKLEDLPRNLVYRKNGENGTFGELFASAFEKNFIAQPPEQRAVRAAANAINLPAAESAESSRSTKLITHFSETRQLNPAKLNLLQNKGVLYVSRQGGLTFVRRDENELITGYTNDSGWTGKADEKGFFYIGNPTTAKRFVLVENPKEALSMWELSSQRDLSSVCFVGCDDGRAPKGFTEFVKSYSEKNAVRIIWALGLTKNNLQDRRYLEQFSEAMLTERSPELPVVEIITCAPKMRYGASWQQQLQSRNIPENLEAMMVRIAESKQTENAPTSTELLAEQGREILQNNALFQRVKTIREKNEIIVAERLSENGSGREMGRYEIAENNNVDSQYSVVSLFGKPVQKALVSDNEAALIAIIETEFYEEVERLAAENNSYAESSQPTLEEEILGVEFIGQKELIPASETVINYPNPRSIKELSAYVRELPLDAVAPRLGLYYRKEERVWIDGEGQAKSHKIWEDTDKEPGRWLDRYNGYKSGRGAINLVSHVLQTDFATARDFLLDQFVPDWKKERAAYGAAVAAEETNGEQKTKEQTGLRLPQRHEGNLQDAVSYLADRGIHFDLLANEMLKKNLYANQYKSPIFVHRTADGELITGASWKSIESNLRNDVEGSNAKAGWYHLGNMTNADRFVIVRDPIEALSYATLNLENLENTAIVSLGFKQATIPEELLNTIININPAANIVVALDDTKRGNQAFLSAQDFFKEENLTRNHPGSEFFGSVKRDFAAGDDWNDALQSVVYTAQNEIEQEHFEELAEETIRAEIEAAAEEFSAAQKTPFAVPLIPPAVISEPAKSAQTFSDTAQRVTLANEMATIYYSGLLSGRDGVRARNYLRERNVSDDSIKNFSIGYAPERWSEITNRLASAVGIGNETELLNSGLVAKSKNENGRLYDRFRNRVMFPILDLQGEIVGFGGREMGDENPKYLNSPETEIYKKGNHLFGLYQAKNAIQTNGYAILVEGYLDAIRLHQEGVANTAATLGTALTRQQVLLLRSLTDQVVINGDNDAAGRAAVFASLPKLLAEDFEIKVLNLSEKDPDEFLNHHSADEYRTRLANSLDWIEFAVEHLSQIKDLKSAIGRREAVGNLMELLQSVPNLDKRTIAFERTIDMLKIPAAIAQELSRKIDITNTPIAAVRETDQALLNQIGAPEDEFYLAEVLLPRLLERRREYAQFLANETGENTESNNASEEFQRREKRYQKLFADDAVKIDDLLNQTSLKTLDKLERNYFAAEGFRSDGLLSFESRVSAVKEFIEQQIEKIKLPSIDAQRPNEAIAAGEFIVPEKSAAAIEENLEKNANHIVVVEMQSLFDEQLTTNVFNRGGLLAAEFQDIKIIDSGSYLVAAPIRLNEFLSRVSTLYPDANQLVYQVVENEYLAAWARTQNENISSISRADFIKSAQYDEALHAEDGLIALNEIQAETREPFALREISAKRAEEINRVAALNPFAPEKEEYWSRVYDQKIEAEEIRILSAETLKLLRTAKAVMTEENAVSGRGEIEKAITALADFQLLAAENGKFIETVMRPLANQELNETTLELQAQVMLDEALETFADKGSANGGAQTETALEREIRRQIESEKTADNLTINRELINEWQTRIAASSFSPSVRYNVFYNEDYRVFNIDENTVYDGAANYQRRFSLTISPDENGKQSFGLLEWNNSKEAGEETRAVINSWTAESIEEALALRDQAAEKRYPQLRIERFINTGLLAKRGAGETSYQVIPTGEAGLSGFYEVHRNLNAGTGVYDANALAAILEAEEGDKSAVLDVVHRSAPGEENESAQWINEKLYNHFGLAIEELVARLDLNEKSATDKTLAEAAYSLRNDATENEIIAAPLAAADENETESESAIDDNANEEQAEPAEERPWAFANRILPSNEQIGLVEKRIARLLESHNLSNQFGENEGYVRFKMPSMNDLVIERIGSKLHVGHWYEQNGDAMLECEMSFEVGGGALKLRNTEVALYGQRRFTNQLDKSFANLFSRNLIDQNWEKALIIGGSEGFTNEINRAAAPEANEIAAEIEELDLQNLKQLTIEKNVLPLENDDHQVISYLLSEPGENEIKKYVLIFNELEPAFQWSVNVSALIRLADGATLESLELSDDTNLAETFLPISSETNLKNALERLAAYDEGVYGIESAEIKKIAAAQAKAEGETKSYEESDLRAASVDAEPANGISSDAGDDRGTSGNRNSSAAPANGMAAEGTAEFANGDAGLLRNTVRDAESAALPGNGGEKSDARRAGSDSESLRGAAIGNLSGNGADAGRREPGRLETGTGERTNERGHRLSDAAARTNDGENAGTGIGSDQLTLTEQIELLPPVDLARYETAMEDNPDYDPGDADDENVFTPAEARANYLNEAIAAAARIAELETILQLTATNKKEEREKSDAVKERNRRLPMLGYYLDETNHYFGAPARDLLEQAFEKIGFTFDEEYNLEPNRVGLFKTGIDQILSTGNTLNLFETAAVGETEEQPLANADYDAGDFAEKMRLLAEWRKQGAAIINDSRTNQVEEAGFQIIKTNCDNKTRSLINSIIGADAAKKLIDGGYSVQQFNFEIETQKFISRAEIKNNPQTIYLFEDNKTQAGGDSQAKEMRGESNAVGIPIKKYPGYSEEDFLTDSEFVENRLLLDQSFAVLAKFPNGTKLVTAESAFGNNLSELSERAPRTIAYLNEKMSAISLAPTEQEITAGTVELANAQTEEAKTAILKLSRIEVRGNPSARIETMSFTSFENFNDFLLELPDSTPQDRARGYSIKLTDGREFQSVIVTGDENSSNLENLISGELMIFQTEDHEPEDKIALLLKDIQNLSRAELGTRQPRNRSLTPRKAATAGEIEQLVNNQNDADKPVKTLQKAVTALLTVCDGAATYDGQGFNGVDSGYARHLGEKPEWTRSDAENANRMLRKYRKQLANFGFEYEALAKDIQNYPEAEQQAGANEIKTDGDRKVIRIAFPFNQSVIDAIKKELPEAQFEKIGNDKFWAVTPSRSNAGTLRQFGNQHGFKITPEAESLLQTAILSPDEAAAGQDGETKPHSRDESRQIKASDKALLVYFDYSAEIHAGVKAIQSARYKNENGEKYWEITPTPESIPALRALSQKFDFEIGEDAREIFQRAEARLKSLNEPMQEDAESGKSLSARAATDSADYQPVMPSDEIIANGETISDADSPIINAPDKTVYARKTFGQAAQFYNANNGKFTPEEAILFAQSIDDMSEPHFVKHFGNALQEIDYENARLEEENGFAVIGFEINQEADKETDGAAAIKPEDEEKQITEEQLQETETQTRSEFQRRPDNYVFSDLRIHKGGEKTKFRQNVDAVKILRTLAAEKRYANGEEMAVLAKFVGWGAVKTPFGLTVPEEWKEEAEILSRVMSAEEIAEAAKATANAHHTSVEIAGKMWRIAEKLGFKGGRMLEPAVGSGNFIGTAPAEISRRTMFYGCDIDPTSLRVAQALYPRAVLENTPYEKNRWKDDTFDLTLTNVPFGGYTVPDNRYKNLKPSVHNYFLLRSLEQTRPGGLVIALTSRFTMDAQETSVREAIAMRGELIDAVRLPNNAFKENAGTEVVTDLLIFRKRENALRLQAVDTRDAAGKIKGTEYHFPGLPEGETDWINTFKIDNPNYVKNQHQSGEPQFSVNRYYAAHPDHVLGETTGNGRMYARKDYTVEDNGTFAAGWDDFVAQLPAGIYQAISERENIEIQSRLEARDWLREGKKVGNYFIENNAVYQVAASGDAIKVNRTEKEIRILGEILALKDTVTGIYRAEITGTNESLAAAEGLRKSLNEQYNAFRGEHGALKSAFNNRLTEGDPDAYRVMNLEKSFNERTGATEKADIFFKPTISPLLYVTSADNIADAMAASLNKHGKLELNYLAELRGSTAAEIKRELVENNLAFENPDELHRGEIWETADIYLSGNVKEKLNLATERASRSGADEERFGRNITALEAVQPEDIPYVDIELNLGTSMMTIRDMKEFIEHLTRAEEKDFIVEYAQRLGRWSVGWRDTSTAKYAKKNENSTAVWGTKHRDVLNLLETILQGKSATVTERGTDPLTGKAYERIDREQTSLAEQKIADIKREFKSWVWTDDDRRTRIHRAYNDKRNNHVAWQPDGKHLQLVGLNPKITPYAHQINYTWRGLQKPSAYAAHEVGTGKTLSLGILAMEKKRLGQANKPALMCLKANIDQVTQAIREAYPHADIFSLDEHFNSASRQDAASIIANNDFDLVVMTYEQSRKLPVSPETQLRYLQSEMNLLTETIGEAIEAEGKKSRLASQLRRRQRNLESKIGELMLTERDQAISFEETGIDYLEVDEGHNFKALPIYTTMQNLKGIPTTRSDRAVDLHIRAEYLRAKYHEPRISPASGTPITNSVAEVYNWMRFCDPERLQSEGVESFDTFAREYTEAVRKLEPTATGTYKIQTRLAKYINLPELRNMMSDFFDVVTAEEAGIKRPTSKTFVVAVPINAAQLAYRDELNERAANLKNVDPKDDNYFKISSDGEKMSMDLRLVETDAEGAKYCKANVAAANALRIQELKPGTVQMIFSETGIHPNRLTGFSVFDEIESKLIAAGVPPERIANISKLNKEKSREAIVKAERGEILFLFGSTRRLGTGVNAQTFVSALHNLDTTWLPSDIVQRVGRGVRQGNILAETGDAVEVYNYVTTGGFDEIKWGANDRKNKFIRQVVTNNNLARSFQDRADEGFSPAEIAAIASGNDDVRRQVELSMEVEELARREKMHRQSALKLRDRLPYLKERLQGYEQSSRIMEIDYEHYQNGKAKRAELLEPRQNAAREKLLELREEIKLLKKDPEKAENIARILEISKERKHWEEQKEGNFIITLDKEIFTDREAAAKKINMMVSSSRGSLQLGEYLGFEIHFNRSQRGNYLLHSEEMVLQNPQTKIPHEVRGERFIDMVDDLDYRLSRFAGNSRSQAQLAKALEQEIAQVEAKINVPFEQAAELSEKTSELEQIERSLKEFNSGAQRERELNGRLEIFEIGSPESAQAEIINQSLKEILEEHKTFEIEPFVSKALTEARIRNVSVSEVEAMYEERASQGITAAVIDEELFTETEADEDEAFDEDAIQLPGMETKNVAENAGRNAGKNAANALDLSRTTPQREKSQEKTTEGINLRQVIENQVDHLKNQIKTTGDAFQYGLFGGDESDVMASFNASDKFNDNAASFRGQPLANYWHLVTARTDGKGRIKLNAAAYELIRSTYEKNRIGEHSAKDFAGTFNEPAAVNALVASLKREEGKNVAHGETFRQMAETIETARGERGGGTVTFLRDLKAVEHEAVHEGSFYARKGKSIEAGHGLFDELVADEAFVIAKPVLLATYKSNDNAIIVEELAAHAAAFEHHKLGVTEDQSKQFLKKYFESIAAQNGALSLKEFEDLNAKSTVIRNEVYARINAAEQREQNDGSAATAAATATAAAITAESNRNAEFGAAAASVSAEPDGGIVRRTQSGESSIANGGERTVAAEATRNSGNESVSERILERREAAERLKNQLWQNGRIAGVSYQLADSASAANEFRNETSESVRDFQEVPNLSAEMREKTAFKELLAAAEKWRRVLSNEDNTPEAFADGSAESYLNDDLNDDSNYGLNNDLNEAVEKVIGNRLIKEIECRANADKMETLVREADDNRYRVIGAGGKTQFESISGLDKKAWQEAHGAVAAAESTGELALRSYRGGESEKSVKRNLRQTAYEQAVAEQSDLRSQINLQQRNAEEKLSDKAIILAAESELLDWHVEKTLAAARPETAARLKPKIAAETLWQMQEEAIKRGDAEGFAALEEIHEQTDLPRSNYAAARLKAVAELAGVKEKLHEFRAADKTGTERTGENVKIKLTKENGEIKIESWSLRQVDNELEYRDEKAKKAASRSLHDLARPIMNKINPVSTVQGTFSWFTDPRGTFQAHFNPIEVFKNDPGVQVARSVYGYFKNAAAARELKTEIREMQSLRQTVERTLTDKEATAAQRAANFRESAEVAESAVEREANLRTSLSEQAQQVENGFDGETIARNLEMPPARFNRAEIKEVSAAATEMQDADLMEKCSQVTGANSELASAGGGLPERRLAQAVMTQTEAGLKVNSLIENAEIDEAGALSIEINAADLAEIEKQSRLGEKSLEWINNLVTENPGLKPDFTAAESVRLENLSAELSPEINRAIENIIEGQKNIGGENQRRRESLTDGLPDGFNNESGKSPGAAGKNPTDSELAQQIELRQADDVMGELTVETSGAAQTGAAAETLHETLNAANKMTEAETEINRAWDNYRKTVELEWRGMAQNPAELAASWTTQGAESVNDAAGKITDLDAPSETQFGASKLNGLENSGLGERSLNKNENDGQAAEAAEAAEAEEAAEAAEIVEDLFALA